MGMVSYSILMIMSNVTSIQLNTRVRETKRRDSTVTEVRERERRAAGGLGVGRAWLGVAGLGQQMGVGGGEGMQSSSRVRLGMNFSGFVIWEQKYLYIKYLNGFVVLVIKMQPF